MRSFPIRRVFSLLALFGLVAGCTPTAPPPGREEPTTITPSKLPELGGYMPPLDDDRIEVAPPQGWHIPSASSKYIVRFQLDPQTKYPSIIITGEDYERIFNVSKENVEEFARQIKSAESVSTVKPFEMGKFIGVTYGKRAKEKQTINKILERLFLETVVAGRKYSIELRTRERSLTEAQPYLFAVANGIKFLKAEPAGEEPGAEEVPGTEEGPGDIGDIPDIPEIPEDTPAPETETKEEPKPEVKEPPKEEAKTEAKEPPEEQPEQEPEKKG